jgi:hypothetical protein
MALAPPPDPVDRRRAGVGLTVYGAVGLVLLGLAMAFVLGAFDGDRGPLGLDAQRRGLSDLLDASSVAVGDAEAAARDADAAMSSTASAAGDGSRFVGDLGVTLHNLAVTLRLSILGSQPPASRRTWTPQRPRSAWGRRTWDRWPTTSPRCARTSSG